MSSKTVEESIDREGTVPPSADSEDHLYGRTGRMTATEGQVTDLAAILLRAAALVAHLDGAVSYVVGIDGDDVIVNEVWESAAAHGASLGEADVRALITEAIPLIASFGDSSEYTVLGGIGLDER
jgi:quinol monooxygenase YgiN